MKKKFLYIFFLSVIPLSFLIYAARQHSLSSPRLHVCTMASYTCQGLNQLMASCKAYNISLDVLGLDQPFSFGKKLRDVKEYVNRLPDDDIVLFTDGFDTLLLASEETILKKFRSMNVPFVIAAETNCHPFLHIAPYYPQSPTKFKYLNSGCYIGYVSYIKKILDEISPIPDETDDQGLLSVYYLYHPKAFTLDYSCNLFLCLWQVKNDEIVIDKENQNIRCLLTGTTPFIVHGNGDKVLYQKIYDEIFLKSEIK